MAGSDVQIMPVSNKRELRDFIMFPFRLYRGDPNWVPPLISDRLKHFDPHHNPFFEHATAQYFRAVRDGETVGTIAAIADEMHPRIWGEPVGFFGAFEVIEDYDVAKALFDAARAWLAQKGREIMRGPMDLNINDECGLLIEGFDGPPVIMMTYNKRYYPDFLERYGFTKAKDLYAYKVDVASYGPNLEHIPERVTRVARVAQERYHVTMRPINMKDFDAEVERIKGIYRRAWAKNWGAIPMTDAEFAYLAQNLKTVVDPDLTYLAFIDDQPVGCFLALPDFCQVAKHLNGRLFPIGWIKYLWYRRKITGLRVIIMGVLEEHRLKGIESLFYQEGCRVAARKGYQWAEMSWILEDNYNVIRGIEGMGGVKYRTYRLYDIPTGAKA
ncbi:MAG: N-acetyltransferase [Chloroflexi bacterium]|nr:N-acetyltransferase [Chloroflexota bacterium]